MKKILLTVAVLIFAFTTNAQIITTFAGNGTHGHSGDGGMATAAAIGSPGAMAFDGSGNLFVAESNGSYIQKITTSGIISTVAGLGYAGYTGDGTAATLASIAPNGIAVDASGNIYFSDYYFVVRKIDTSGIISTIAGSGIIGDSGDGGPATDAKLYNPEGIVVDGSGNIYIADAYSNVVRKVSTNGTISTFAGNRTAGYSGDGGPATAAELSRPWGLAIDGAGNIYIADKDNEVIRKVNSSGIIKTVAGNGTSGFGGDGGPAKAAKLAGPLNVKVDASGNIYISDLTNFRIRKVSSSGIITTVAGNGTITYAGDGAAATASGLNYPEAVAVDASGNIFISAGNGNVIYKVGTASTQVTENCKPMNSLTIYPNPNKGDFTVHLPSEYDEQVNIVITDACGRIVKELNATTNIPINVSCDFPTGVYCISGATEHAPFHGKLVVE